MGIDGRRLFHLSYWMRLEYGSNMARIWLEYGSNMARIWRGYGVDMAWMRRASPTSTDRAPPCIRPVGHAHQIAAFIDHPRPCGADAQLRDPSLPQYRAERLVLLPVVVAP